MALVESINIALGTKLPYFELPCPDGRLHSSETLMGENGLLVVFTCNHCPYALAIWPRLTRLAAWAKEQGIATVAINPNIHPAYPEDAPGVMKTKIQEWGIAFPYLVDETQSVARDFQAQCTPDLYLFDSKQQLFYHGRLDDNWQNEAKVTKQELKVAMTAMVRGQALADSMKPSMGCSIKWKD